MTLHRSIALIGTVALSLALTTSCQRRDALGPTATPQPNTETPRAAAASAPTPRRGQTPRRLPAGATCSGRDDCTSDQICVEHRCAYRTTSVAGEILAAAAEAQARAGNWDGAIESYDAAFREFEARGAPVPPEIACAAAELMLRTGTDPETRERGAQRADLCFRHTVPNHPARTEVRRALARLRFDGLELGRFDQEDPAARFFTQEPSRPTLESVVVDIEMPDLKPRQPAEHTAVRQLLQSETGTGAIAECFIQDWETNHRPSAEATVRLSFSTRLRDMGTHDVYEPQLDVVPMTTAEDGFEPCLARALPAIVQLPKRSGRSESWDQTVRITAQVR